MEIKSFIKSICNDVFDGLEEFKKKAGSVKREKNYPGSNMVKEEVGALLSKYVEINFEIPIATVEGSDDYFVAPFGESNRNNLSLVKFSVQINLK